MQRRLYLIFVKLWVLVKGHNSVVSGYPTFRSFPWVDGWSTDPRVFGRHTWVAPFKTSSCTRIYFSNSSITSL